MTETAEQRCRRYRRRILEISRQVTAAHIAPAFSCLEIVDALYNGVMREQDIFIMSKGHGCLAQYVVLEDLGKLPRAALDYYCLPVPQHFGNTLPQLGAHPDYAPALGIHASTGSLGHGLGIAAGQALAEKLRGSDVWVYVLLSDGECQEGSTWEAAMVAANLRLDNLIAVVDHNDFGGMDRMSEHHPALDPLGSKFKAFGWWAKECSGHVTSSIQHSVQSVMPGKRPLGLDCPLVVVCETTKGFPISFMCNNSIWHYRSPSPEEYKQALEELSDE